jgi:AcrR family transcriptional regulator
MTDSITARGAGRASNAGAKRERLVESAVRLFYEQGVERTTLADIAEAADVPLGNVYYYFKTKDELVRAVVDTHILAIEEVTTDLGRHRTPAARLKALVALPLGGSDDIAKYGCPQGSLCIELHKQRAGEDDDAGSGRLLQASVAWAEQQFKEMGRRDARDLAVQLIGSYQGAAVLSQALSDPSVLKKEARRAERWIDALASGEA